MADIEFGRSSLLLAIERLASLKSRLNREYVPVGEILKELDGILACLDDAQDNLMTEAP